MDTVQVEVRHDALSPQDLGAETSNLSPVPEKLQMPAGYVIPALS